MYLKRRKNEEKREQEETSEWRILSSRSIQNRSRRELLSDYSLHPEKGMKSEKKKGMISLDLVYPSEDREDQ